MKFDDSDEDYFLHDFSASGEGGAPSFDFSDGTSSGNGGPLTQQEPRRRKRHGWFWFTAIVILVIAGAITVRYFVPYITESRVTGYVTLVEKRGIIFPTFECEMVSESQFADTSRVYSRDVYFSIPDDDMALRLQQFQGTGHPVTVTLKKYYGALPWRGASNTVAVDFQLAGND